MEFDNKYLKSKLDSINIREFDFNEMKRKTSKYKVVADSMLSSKDLKDTILNAYEAQIGEKYSEADYISLVDYVLDSVKVLKNGLNSFYSLQIIMESNKITSEQLNELINIEEAYIKTILLRMAILEDHIKPFEDLYDNIFEEKSIQSKQGEENG